MDLLANTHTSLALVNLVFAAIALGVGFAAGAWVCGGSSSDTDKSEQKPQVEKKETTALTLEEIEAAMMAGSRLKDLASGVASDVDEHSANIGRIEEQLSQSREGDADTQAAAVYKALAEISEANEQLQQKLEVAEQQIETQSQLIRTHESEARTDALTKLANRRAFDDEVNRRFSELHRRGVPFSLLIGDVDHFKKFNDTHGHQAGDEVLRQVGKVMSQRVRDIDVPCRYGGEEFAVVMPATLSEDATVVVERIRESIEDLEIEFEGKTLRVTMSLGLAQAAPNEDANLLIRRADDALYASKDAGRNNSHRHENGECIPIVPGGKEEEPQEEEAEGEQELSVILEGLPNRTKFLEMLRLSVREANKKNTSAALLTANFEGYKDLLEEFGPAVAQLTLDSIAQFLDNAIRDVDYLGRLDAGQFVVFMPGKDSEGAQKIGERISEALSNCTVPLGEKELTLTTSMTTTELNDEDTAVTFMRRAETGLTLCADDTSTPVVI